MLDYIPNTRTNMEPVEGPNPPHEGLRQIAKETMMILGDLEQCAEAITANIKHVTERDHDNPHDIREIADKPIPLKEQLYLTRDTVLRLRTMMQEIYEEIGS